jgi:glycosyltransferase involved in cell wall biosynthesis
MPARTANDPGQLDGAEPQTPRERVTLIVPCFNEENALPYLANTLRSVEALLSPRYEVETIFVDDHSVDRSWPLLSELFGGRSRCLRLRHARNRGVAACIGTGLRSARSEIVCSIDCDCSYDPHELAQMIPLLGDGVAMVTASPYHPDGHVRNVPRWRLLLSRTLSRMYRVILRQPLYTYTSCFRVYRRSAVLGVEPHRGGFLGVAEMIGKLTLSGATVVEYPTTLEVRVLGYSKMRVLRTVVGHVGLIATLTAERVVGRRRAAHREVPHA